MRSAARHGRATPGCSRCGRGWRGSRAAARRRRSSRWAAVVVAAAAIPATEVRIGDEHRGVPELRADSVYNLDTAVITERFEIGVDVLTVIAETVPEGCIDYEVMSTLDDFEWHMRNVDGVQSVLSLAGVARNINSNWNEGSLKWRTLPRKPLLPRAVRPRPCRRRAGCSTSTAA